MEDNTCPGCQRNEIHFMCPAYGTPFYMSGVPYSVRVESLFKEFPLELQNIIFDICKMVWEENNES